MAMNKNPTMTAMLADVPIASLALVLVVAPPELVLVVLEAVVDEASPTTTEDCVVLTHISLAGPVAFVTSVISAHCRLQYQYIAFTPVVVTQSVMGQS